MSVCVPECTIILSFQQNSLEVKEGKRGEQREGKG